MFLQTETIYLRALESTDLEFLYALENDTSVWRVSNTVGPYSREVLEQYLEQATADIYTVKQLRLLICTTRHQPVGAIDLFDFDPLHLRAGIGILIAENFRGRHLATQALDLLLTYCRDYLLLHQVYCGVAIDNEASLKLFIQAGFTKVGIRKQWLRIKNGWLDVQDYQKIL
jgi:diamine N-acetyltransferase